MDRSERHSASRSFRAAVNTGLSRGLMDSPSAVNYLVGNFIGNSQP